MQGIGYIVTITIGQCFGDTFRLIQGNKITENDRFKDL